MPSIPQSLLWISLVVLWLFVLVPMLVSKRDAVRRTSDVALATRVLTSGSSARLLKRGGPAAGHRSAPDWQQDTADAEHDDHEDVDEDEPAESESRVFVAAAEQGELDYLDVDVIADDDSDVLPLSEAGFAQARAQAAEAEAEARAQAEAEERARAEAEARAQEEAEAQARAEAAAQAEAEADEADDEAAEEPVADAESADDDAEADGYEYETIDDSSGLEAAADAPMGGRASVRRPRADTRTAAAVSARKYEFRKRVLMSLAVILVLSALMAFTVVPTAWWICGGAAGATVLYLAYLRRQTRIEQQVRARRARRAERPRAQGESARPDPFEVVPSRLRRPGVAVLEIDDEDPVFEHLEYASTAGEYQWRGDLPRASGQ
ncbi:divisome protein SepX/GlpR [[Mycobacterium] nativiensis]|uniref:Gephyrin-like molybdotransferase receptor GlpR n=1 Tax=[Mycobacterium] nativiensis TaxID=2855503 RepID=A0ABU5XUG2_9MYCO|nr:gephyrin-like molybdotransferase receptor GlpR [Mycolicibacter sp. MYC340]MEB3031622.1 gephyrin-like molybdotransferase receptor GlpR [Mycolicibacter sp. MYC340]